MNQQIITRDTIKTVNYRSAVEVPDTFVYLVPKKAILIDVPEPALIINTDLRKDIKQLEYICKEQEIEDMPTFTIEAPVIIKAYPDDALVHDLGIFILSVATITYVILYFNKWQHLFKELRRCIFVS